MLAMAAAKLGFRAAIYAPKDDSPAFQAGLVSGQDFIYDAKNDHYTCPAGKRKTCPNNRDHLTKPRWARTASTTLTDIAI
jgi:hypothetical protein